MTTADPEGWYPDPKNPGQQRWWDGSQWTGFTTAWAQDATPSNTTTARTSSAIDTTPSTSTSRRTSTGSSARPTWRPSLTTVLVAALALVIAIIGAVTGGIGGFLLMIAFFGLGAGLWTLLSRRPSWLNLPRSRGAGGIALGASFALLLLGAVLLPHSPQPASTDAAAGISAAETSSPTARRTPAPAPAAKSTPTPTSPPAPIVTVQVVETTEQIAFAQSSYEDANVDAGTNVIVTAGAPGTKVLRWEITLTDGVETGRALVSESVSVAPTDEVTAIGIRQPAPPEPAPALETGGCDPNYTGACVPIASDVDCEGGGGNGPAYVSGPVQVIGPDIYELDRDGDGIACDA